MATTRVKWIEGKSFLGVGENGRSAVMSPNDGPGVSPMQMLLLGLGGCTAIDIVDILEKQRQPLEDIELKISGERGAEWPKPWTRIHIHYVIVGDRLDPHKVERAIELSVHKYCGAHATLSGVAEITHDYEIRSTANVVNESA
jgi:putative redox protein